MESQLALGFKEAASSEVFGEGNYKLVPWISWDDWTLVKDYLFSSFPDSIDLALRRISAWRSRGCIPVIIEVTASIVETQQKDPLFRDGISGSDLLAEDMLTQLYCMSVMRLVNGIVEKTRKKNEISIGEAADVIGIPRMLIDIRHECSHRDLPSLKLVRLASMKALDWLKTYYWEPQKMAIPYPSDRTASFEKEIKFKIGELAFSLDVKQASSSNSPPIKRKRSKKHINKALKNVVKLYSSFPSEVVSIILEFLLMAQESTAVVANNSQIGDSGVYNNNNTKLDDWKPLIMKLSNKEPDFLISLLKAVVHMIETHKAALNHESGEEQTERVSYLFRWLVGNLKSSRRKIITKEKSLPKSTLIHVLGKCLAVCDQNNNLASAALVLAQTALCNHTLVQKLSKLTSLHNNTSNPYTTADPQSFYNQEEMFIKQEANKLELLKQKRLLLKKPQVMVKGKRWRVAKSWKPCPIGMLPPCDVGSSGVVPVLDEINKSSGKREADCPSMVLDVKKLKCYEEKDELIISKGVKNHRLMMIGGLWTSLTEDQLLNMASAVRILV